MRGVRSLSASAILFALAPIGSAASQDRPACIQVELEGEREVPFECLNAFLAPVAGKGRAPRAATIDRLRDTPPTRAGTFSHAATAQRLGPNFGRSAHAWRPAPNSYSTPAPAR